MNRIAAFALAMSACASSAFLCGARGVSAQGATASAPTTPGAIASIPDRLTDAEFWKFVNDVSEPGGFFRSDNFLSNERQYQWVLADLKRITKPGGVYLGVGPEQNFTYIVAMEPKLAVIFDIRRQNLIQHLMYKALFELSANRSEFMARLFCKPIIARFDSTTRIDSLAIGYGATPGDTAVNRRGLQEIKETLVKHGFTLSAEDLASLDYVRQAFCQMGLALDYTYGIMESANQGRFSPNGGLGMEMPNYHEIVVSSDEAGVQRGYLATEANFRALKSMQERNLIIPVVGDFAGPKAIRAVGQYLKERNATVNAFYASNVEQYLFQQGDDWSKYYSNVATLPIDSTSMFIRSRFRGFSPSGRQSVLSSMQELLRLFAEGKIGTYMDVLSMSN